MMTEHRPGTRKPTDDVEVGKHPERRAGDDRSPAEVPAEPGFGNRCSQEYLCDAVHVVGNGFLREVNAHPVPSGPAGCHSMSGLRRRPLSSGVHRGRTGKKKTVLAPEKPS